MTEPKLPTRICKDCRMEACAVIVRPDPQGQYGKCVNESACKRRQQRQAEHTAAAAK